MANKFQKSVLDRLEQEAAQQKTTAPSKSRAKEQPPLSPGEPSKAQAKPQKVGTVPAKKAVPTPDLNDYLQQTPPRQAKNKTFYLDLNLIDAIKRESAARGITDSKLVGDILRYVLLPEEKRE